MDMATIRTTCPIHEGEIDLDPTQVKIIQDEGSSKVTYRFHCAVCDEDIEKTADPKIVELLATAGVETLHKQGDQLVKENGEPENANPESRTTPDAPAFTQDDVIDWHFLLEDDEALKEWMNA